MTRRRRQPLKITKPRLTSLKVEHNLPNRPVAVLRHNNIGLVAPLRLRIVDFISPLASIFDGSVR